ncbi:MAG: alanine--tRNA ligase, partial [Acetobacteraceae bacterium]|nr:alanine--tRNA ligase [Acetobacteraceae bacterium]
GLLSDETGRLAEGAALPGAVAFKLYDTFGFPLDLTQDALREQGRTVDTDGFNAAMDDQRRRARAAWAGSGEAATETVWFEIREKLGASEFLGYSTEAAEGEVTALVMAGHPVARAEAGSEVALLLNQTPFYAESGGQLGDHGVISGPGFRIQITDTQKKLGELFVHLGLVTEGVVELGKPVVATVDHTRRTAIRAHHSATHLLHEALRRRLGTHVQQKGSLNGPDRLRFDVSQPTPIGRDDLAWVEAEVNARIRENTEVRTRLMTPDAAVAEGAMALFGEKYGDEVRVVSMGVGEEARPAWSIELCGGTHVRRTGDIGLLRIVAEAGVSAGVRRIEAVCAEAALALVNETDRRLSEAAGALRASPAELPDRIAALMEDRRKLERQVSDLQKKLATGGAAADIEDIAGIKLAARNLGDVAPRELKGLAEAILVSLGSGIAALVSSAEGKASIVVAVSADLVGTHSAVDLVRAAAAAVGGKGGGGRPDMAQAGGPEGDKADDALAAIRTVLGG